MRYNNHKEAFKQCNRILVYGVGNQFEHGCSRLLQPYERKLYLFDRKRKKMTGCLDNKTVLSGHLIQDIYTPGDIVVIGCINNQYEIACYLNYDLGIPEEALYTYVDKYYEDLIYDHPLIEENMASVRKISERLGDEESKDYYLSAIDARLKLQPKLLKPNPNSIKISEYSDVVTLHTGDIIIDCGAYDGDTASYYYNALSGNLKVFAFEPFGESYDKICKMIQKNKWNDTIIPYNYAISNVTGKRELYYDNDDFDMGINLSNKDGQIKRKINVDTLDNIFLDKKVDFIKMDIEGEEYNALVGASELIKKNHPRMMISGYHKIEDFWVIPQTIWDIDAAYRIYCGHSPGVSTELEFYCI